MNILSKGNMKLRTKLITISLLLLTLPSLIIGLVGYYESKQQLNSFGEVGLRNSVRFTISMIEMLDNEVKNGNLSIEDAQEKVKQMMLGRKDAKGIRPINKRFDLGENGYLSAFSKDGIQLVHPKLEGKNVYDLVDKDNKPFVKELIQKGLNGGGFTTYYWSLPNDETTIAPKIVYTELDPRWGWIVSAGTYMSDFNKGATIVLYILLVTLGGSLLAGGGISWLFANHITRPIVRLSEQAAEVASGNLLDKPLVLARGDEIGRLVEAFNQMVGHLRQMLRQVGASSVLLASSSEELTANAEQSTKASEHIALIAQEVTESTKIQASNLTEGILAAQKLAKGIDDITLSTQEMAASALRTTEVAIGGNSSIQKAVSQMQTIQNTIIELDSLIRDLGKHSMQIGHIVDVITGIAEQTNLLSLNAAIEAARAGEHGRGFAVVADEVRKLASQSSESAKQITALIKSIQEQTGRAVHSMEKGSNEFAVGIRMVNEAGISFDHINQAFAIVSNQVDKAQTSSQEISRETEKIVSFINTILEAANNTALATDNASAATEQQLATMEEITSSSIALAKMAEELRSIVDRFRI